MTQDTDHIQIHIQIQIQIQIIYRYIYRYIQMIPDEIFDDPRCSQMIPGDMISDDPSPK